MRQGSWSSVFSVFLFGVLGAATVSRLIPLGADLSHEFGFSPSQFGWLISLVALPAALLAIPSGVIVDRFGSRPVFSSAALLAVLANCLYFVGSSAAWILFARFLEGTAIVFLYTAAPAFLMASCDGPRRATAMTIWAAYMPTGTAVGLWLAAAFAGSPTWRYMFLIHGALYLGVALLNLRQPRIQMPANAVSALGLIHRLREIRQAYARAPLLLLGLAFFLMISLGFGANSTFPSYFARIHHASVAAASSVVGLLTLLMIPGSLGVAALLASGVRQVTIFTGLAAVGVVVGSAAFLPSISPLLRFFVLGTWYVVSGASIATLMATLPLVAEAQRRGAAAAMLNQSAATATFVNPPLWLPLGVAGGWSPFAALMTTGWVVAAVSVWSLMRRPRKPAAMERSAGIAPHLATQK